MICVAKVKTLFFQTDPVPNLGAPYKIKKNAPLPIAQRRYPRRGGIRSCSRPGGLALRLGRVFDAARLRWRDVCLGAPLGTDAARRRTHASRFPGGIAVARIASAALA